LGSVFGDLRFLGLVFGDRQFAYLKNYPYQKKIRKGERNGKERL
jgi:hypothetical protein